MLGMLCLVPMLGARPRPLAPIRTMLRCSRLLGSRSARVGAATRCRRLAVSAAAMPTPLYSEERKPLVVVGSINADLVCEVDRLPKPGETLAADSLKVYPGGKGANQAAACAKLGYPTYFVGQVGRDAYAGMLRTALADCGVDTSLLYTVDGSCGTAIILLQPSGENSIIIVGGANTSEEWQITDEVTQAIQNAGAVLLQREIPEVVNTIFAKIAQSARVPVVLDAGGVDKPLGVDLLSNVTILSPNETELARLTGLPTKSEKQVRAAAEALIHQGVNTVLVKMGAKGSMLVDIHGACVRQEAAPVLHVVDTTGAGDCFTGALAVALAEGKGYQEAMQFASAAAAVCISRAGAMPSLPTRQETLRELGHAGGGGGAGGGHEEGSDSHQQRHGGFGGGGGGSPLGGAAERRHSGGGGGGGYGGGGDGFLSGFEEPRPPKSSFWD